MNMVEYIIELPVTRFNIILMVQLMKPHARPRILVAGAILIVGLFMFFSSGDTPNSDVSGEAGTKPAAETLPSSATQTKEAPRAASPKPAPTTVVAPGSSLPSRTPEGLYIISYTNRGFEPNTLQIAQREGVRFINRSDKAMRVFAVEENNQVYGSLSQSKSVGKGETFDFLFTLPGNWAYYNKNNPADRGTVVVVPR